MPGMKARAEQDDLAFNLDPEPILRCTEIADTDLASIRDMPKIKTYSGAAKPVQIHPVDAEGLGRRVYVAKGINVSPRVICQTYTRQVESERIVRSSQPE